MKIGFWQQTPDGRIIVDCRRAVLAGAREVVVSHDPDRNSIQVDIRKSKTKPTRGEAGT